MSNNYYIYIHSVPVIWAKLIFVIQTLICKYVFLEDKGKGDSKFIPITNRWENEDVAFSLLFICYMPVLFTCTASRLYNWFAFALFFYNGFAGLVGALTRILINVVFGLVLMFRLDMLSLPKDFAWWDFGMWYVYYYIGGKFHTGDLHVSGYQALPEALA